MKVKISGARSRGGMRVKRAMEEMSFFTLPLWEVKRKKDDRSDS